MHRWKSYGVLLAGIAAVSFAAIFIRLADAPPVVVAALRLIFSSLVIAPFALGSKSHRRSIGTLSGGDVRLVLLAGTLLALHFILWISSLSLTGVASSVVFVATNPLFVALYTVLVLKDRVNRVFWLGLAVAIVGGATLGWTDLHAGGGKWKGDALAILGAIAAAGYFLAGSRLRSRLSLLAYVFPVYSVAAGILAVTLAVSGSTLAGYARDVYLYCFLMALVCQIFGHSAFNWALRYLKTTVVTIGILGEPVGATVLAFLVLGEAVGAAEIIGGGCIIAGIFLVLHFNPDVTGAGR
jgi:drug/metabolite transporter (DMT)-like permease